MSAALAQGRLKGLKPVAVIDIGSNSIRVVIYEGIVRSPTVLFNEKILCGLGKASRKPASSTRNPLRRRFVR